MRDHETGRSRGFGFITYGTDSEAVTAIQELNEQEFHGKRIRVNFANAQSAGGFRHDNHGSSSELSDTNLTRFSLTR